MVEGRFRVGIVGLQPGRSWASRAHIPALRALPDTYEIAGTANTSRASAEAAAAACGLARGFESVGALVRSPEVDIVAVTVKVPHHHAIVKAALGAGKHVYCEWPLGNGLAEAEELAALARGKGVLGVVGTQARVAPVIQYLRRLLADGFVGEVLSSTITARGRGWGATVESTPIRSYTLDVANGATMLTIPMGHMLSALREVLGEITEVSAIVANRRHFVRALDTGKTLPMSAPDQVLVSGRLAGGVPVAIHYRGGEARGTPGLFWEINGSEGDLRVTSTSGHAQMDPLSLEGGRGDEKVLRPLDPPAEYLAGCPEDAIVGNVARMYARMAADLRSGTSTAPTFADAVGLHRVISAIEAASDGGHRVSPTGGAPGL